MKPSFERSFLSVVTLLALTFGATEHAPAYSMDAASTSPEGLLNPDGTLNMHKTVNGTLDTAGWHVQMDPLRGPVFAPAALAAPNEWASVGWAWAGAFIDTDYVSTVAVSGKDVYVGGNFHDINNNGTVLTAADNIAKWDSLTGTWSALGSNGAGEGSLNNTVYAIAISGTDLYVGGLFTDVNNNGTSLSAADYVAKWDGTNWLALGSNGAGDGAIKDFVNVIAVSGTDLYVGGNFIDVNNNGTILATADTIAKWDGANWSALGSNGAGDGALNGIVKALTVSGTDVYVGGIFNNGAGLPAADHVAKWDSLTGNWSALGSNGAGDGSLNAAVRAIAVSGTDVYVGGDFIDVNNNGTSLPAADDIAKWDGTNWSALGSNGAGDGSLNGWSSGIDISGTDVYVTGSFTNVNNNGTSLPAADYAAKWDTLTGNWSALGSNGAGDGSLNSRGVDIVISGTDIYVTGSFTNVNNNGVILQTADQIAKWDTLTGNWFAVGTNSIGGPLGNTVKAIAVSGTDVYVGGLFTNVSNNGAADYIAKWDSLTGIWSALGSNGAGDGALNNDVHTIAVSGANLYVGGRFTNVNNLPAADYVAKWDGTNWSALGSSDAGNGSLNNTVNAIAVSGTYVYVGGDFTDINNNETGTTRAGYIARWDGRLWQPLGANAVRARVNAIAVSGTGVYAGGDFTDVYYNGLPQYAADYIAKWNGTRWSALGSDGDGSNGDGALNGTVNAIAVSETGVYVGGQFTNINNNGTNLPAADYIAKWDGTNWSALGSNGSGDGAINDYVDAIAVHETGVYVGGEFTDVNNNGTSLPAADNIAKWYGSAWSALGANGTGNGAVNSSVHAIAANETDIYVGGSFKNVNNNGTILPAADFIAAYGIEPHLTVTINRTASSSYTYTRLLSFTAIFSEAVSGFTNTDVNVALDVACNPTVTVTGSGTTYNVALTSMTKPCIATVSIPAGAVNSISHPAYVNLASTGLYNSQQYQYAIKQYRSQPANDGWILESAAGSNKGGSFNNTAKILSVGDDSANREYRIISHFDTSYDPIPAAAIITGINYRISQANVTGTNPLTTHGSLRTYLKVPYFGMSANLEVLDYHAGGDGGACIFDSTPIPNVLTEGAYRCLFFPVAYPLLPRNGTIELRVQFGADDADSSTDLLNIYSGENTPNEWFKPQLFVSYYLLP